MQQVGCEVLWANTKHTQFPFDFPDMNDLTDRFSAEEKMAGTNP
jgi:hypothetical protein